MNSFNDDIIEDLEHIYTLGLEKGNLAVALKAKELLAKHINFFKASSHKNLSLADLKDEDIQRLMGEIKELLAKKTKK
ncbi:MAG: hypothetical protein K2Y08_07435 [Alphaproteobacteria bacterium]|nr:hypothetical protein [Alphaproteobacteria bacterium]